MYILVRQLAGCDYEKFYEGVDLMQLLRRKLTKVSQLNFNYFVQHACKKPDQLMQMIFESTVLGVSLDLQTYIKVIYTLC